MKKLLCFLLIFVVMLFAVSCDNPQGKPDNGPQTDNPGGENNKPDDPGNTEKPGDSTIPDEPVAPGTVVVYLINRAEWESVGVYYWNDSYDIDCGWPGVQIYENLDGIYKAHISDEFKYVIFNDFGHGAQTADLNIPTDDRIVYDNLDKCWITYDEALDYYYPIDDPTDPGDDPTNPGDDPTDPGDDPTDPGDDPTDPGDDPTDPGDDPTDPGDDPTDPGDDPTDPGDDPTDPGDDPTDPGNDYVDITDEERVFAMLFAPESHVSLRLDISNSELKKIQKDYEKYSSFGSKSPIYRMADLYVDITDADGVTYSFVINQVGVRMKGNTSRTNFYSDNDGMYNLVHFKISFQETFDDAAYYGSDTIEWTDSAARKERKNRTFATLEKIDMRWNRNDDPTYIRETYAYDLFRSFGVLAPHTTLASVNIGKDHAGVFTIYEPIDKIFLEKNLPAEAIGGDLYKLGWTNEGATFTSFSSYGVEDEDAGKFYVYDLKTNKKTSTHQSLKDLISMLNSSGMTKDKFASLVDLENFMYYCAVSYMVGNPDDLRNNYNNCYIYFRKDTGKVVFIPYDLDRGLGVNTWNPYKDGMTTDSPFMTNNVCGNQRNPLFKKTVCEGGLFIDEYVEALKAVDQSEMLTNEGFKARFDMAKALYAGETATSKTYHNAGNYSFKFNLTKTCKPSDGANMSFTDYMQAKRETLYKYLGNLGNNNPDDFEEEQDPISGTFYIRADFTDWSNDSKYIMTDMGDGVYAIELNRSGEFRFKVYNNDSGKWYGSEKVSEDCTVSFTTDSHTNIKLASGKYYIVFDTKTSTITIEKK